MENKKAIEILKTECCAECSNQPLNVLECSANECPFKQAILLAIKALEAQGWIPVTERLPESTDDVLVFDGCDMFVAWNSGAWNRWHSSDDKIDENTPIIAWMPLPEPYTKEETT